MREFTVDRLVGYQRSDNIFVVSYSKINGQRQIKICSACVSNVQVDIHSNALMSDFCGFLRQNFCLLRYSYLALQHMPFSIIGVVRKLCTKSVHSFTSKSVKKGFGAYFVYVNQCLHNKEY